MREKKEYLRLDREYVKDELEYRLNRAKFLLFLWENKENVVYETSEGVDRNYPCLKVSGHNPVTDTDEEDTMPLYYRVDDDYCEDISVESGIYTRIFNLRTDIHFYEMQLEKCEEIYDTFYADVDTLFSKLAERCDDLRIEGTPSCLENLLVDVLMDRGYWNLKNSYRDYDD